MAAVGPGKSSGTMGLPRTLDRRDGGVLTRNGVGAGVVVRPGVSGEKLVWNGSVCTSLLRLRLWRGAVEAAEVRGTSEGWRPRKRLRPPDDGGSAVVEDSVGNLLRGTSRSPSEPMGLTRTLGPVLSSSTASTGMVGCGLVGLPLLKGEGVGVGVEPLKPPGEDEPKAGGAWEAATTALKRSLSDSSGAPSPPLLPLPTLKD